MRQVLELPGYDSSCGFGIAFESAFRAPTLQIAAAAVIKLALAKLVY